MAAFFISVILAAQTRYLPDAKVRSDLRLFPNHQRYGNKHARGSRGFAAPQSRTRLDEHPSMKNQSAAVHSAGGCADVAGYYFVQVQGDPSFECLAALAAVAYAPALAPYSARVANAAEHHDPAIRVFAAGLIRVRFTPRQHSH